MDDVRRELAALRARLRLQTIVSLGVLLILVFAMGGADAVARAMVASDGWILSTKNSVGTDTARLTVTSDVATAEIKVANANIELAQQASDPGLTTPGTLWYDSAAAKLKYYGATGWVETASKADINQASAGLVNGIATLIRTNGDQSLGDTGASFVDLTAPNSVTFTPSTSGVAVVTVSAIGSVYGWGSVGLGLAVSDNGGAFVDKAGTSGIPGPLYSANSARGGFSSMGGGTGDGYNGGHVGSIGFTAVIDVTAGHSYVVKLRVITIGPYNYVASSAAHPLVMTVFYPKNPLP